VRCGMFFALLLILETIAALIAWAEEVERLKRK
jgi:hypothetical protein